MAIGEEIGVGAGGGLISGLIVAFLVALGLRERVKCLEEGKLSKEVFEEYRGGVETAMKELKEKIERMDLKIDLLLKR
jgi:hypothetical protein